ncbi:MAG: pyridoxal-phosphate dependent enzyme [Anaerolineae bacterium]
MPCLRCGRDWPLDAARWRCRCGGVLQIVGGPTFELSRVRGRDYTLWRYQEALPLPDGAEPVTLGEGWTPLVHVAWNGRSIGLKLESLNPTGSFKDRGAALLVAVLRGSHVQQVVEDSSGNAGAALSAYAARAGLEATIYIPAHASRVKQAQIGAHGARVVPVSGSRSDTARAVLSAVDQGAVYATHAYSPFYAHGMKTIAYELWEQLDGAAPEAVVVPLGHGGLLLGLHRGFGELLSAGLIECWPRLFGVQADACAPMARAWERSAKEVTPVAEGSTVAGGVRIADPPWGREVLSAVRESDGAILALSDEEALAAQNRLARRGFYVEPTSALAVAALDHLGDGPERGPALDTVVVLTGSGFKSTRKMR